MPFYATKLPCDCGRRYALAILTSAEAEDLGLAPGSSGGGEVRLMYCEHGRGLGRVPAAEDLQEAPEDVARELPRGMFHVEQRASRRIPDLPA